MVGGDIQGVAAVKFQGPNVIGMVYKDTDYGAETKALAGIFVFGALLGEEVLDGGDAEGAGDSLLGEVYVDYGVELAVVLGDPVGELAVDGAQSNQIKSNKQLQNPFILLTLQHGQALQIPRWLLPQAYVRKADRSGLSCCFLTEKLKASMSDVVFKADTILGFRINFCFLFEHKSYIDDKAPFQILHYISSAMLKRAINKEEQRLVIPILFYHGEAPWDYESLADKFAALDEGLKIYLPRFDYLFHNYQAKPDEEIRQASNPKLTAALIAMKHFYEQGYLLKQMQFLLLHATDEHGNLYKPLLVYLFDKLPDQMDAIQKAMGDLPPPVKNEAMSILDAYEARGEAKGKAEGKAEGYSEKTLQTCINMIQDGFDNATICRVLEVDDAYVDEVREQLRDEEQEG